MISEEAFSLIVRDLTPHSNEKMVSSRYDAQVFGNILISFLAGEITRLVNHDGGLSSNEPPEAE